MTLYALILAVMASLAHHEPTREQVTIAEAIEAAVQADAERAPISSSHDEDAVLMTLVAWHESRFLAHPPSWSWDSKAGRVCGVWQLDCRLARGLDVDSQARAWLRLAHAYGLSYLSPSAPQATARERAARRLLSHALEAPFAHF